MAKKSTTTTTEPADPPPGLAIDGVEVRRLGTDDAAAVQRLYERCTDFHELAEGMPTRPAAGAEEIEALPPGKMSTDKHVFGIVAADGELAGYVDLVRDYPGRGEWWLSLLMLDPAARGAGLGSRIVRGAAEWAAARGARALLLGVLEQNPRAERFWQRQGFAEVDRQPYTSDTGRPSRIVVMRRTLARAG
jgi:GNAT superfamily N-acetyltransferase